MGRKTAKAETGQDLERPADEYSDIIRRIRKTAVSEKAAEPKEKKTLRGKKYERTLTAVATALGISYRTLLSWKARKGFPAAKKSGYNVEAIAEFIAANRRDNSFATQEEGDEERRQKIRKLKADADLRELKVQEMRGLLINAREIAERHARDIEVFRRNIFRLLVELPPRLANLTDPSTIEEELRSSFNSIFGEMESGNNV